MSKAFHKHAIFSAIAIASLGMQVPAAATVNPSSSLRENSTIATFQTQSSFQIAQANNCRRISRVGGAIVYNNSRGTGGGEVLEQGTRVQINPNNFSGDFIQIDAINDTPRAGFIDKRALGLCSDEPLPPAAPVNNCRLISRQGGAIIYSNLNGTRGGEVLEQGTRVQINRVNFRGNLIQIDAVNDTPRVGFVDKLALTSCNSTSPANPTPNPAPVSPQATGCYRIRGELDRVKNGLRVYGAPSSSSTYVGTLKAGQVIRLVNPNEYTVAEANRWVRVNSPVVGFVSERTIGTPDEGVSNFAPAACRSAP